MFSTKVKDFALDVLEKADEFCDLVNGFSLGSPIYNAYRKLDDVCGDFDAYDYLDDNDLIKRAETLTEIMQEKLDAMKDARTYSKKAMDMIKERADKKYGYIEFVNPFTNVTFKVAKLPFLMWCIGDTPYSHGKEKGDILYDTRSKLSELWGETLSSSGEKLPNDDEFHNEWIRSLGLEPDNDFYKFIEKDENLWFHELTCAYRHDYVDYISDEPDTFLNYIDVVSKENSEKLYEELDLTMIMFRFKCIEENNDKYHVNTLSAIPYNINKKTKFPIYFTPILEKEFGDDHSSNMEYVIKTRAIVVENSDESVNEIAINLSDFDNSLIFTRNASKTAHLINISSDLSLNIFYLAPTIDINVDCVYSIDEYGEIIKVAECGFSNPALPLSTCGDIKNFKNLDVCDKVKNLSKLYNHGYNVPDGFYILGKSIPEINLKELYYPLIARSAGSSEGNKKASFSGMFKSVKIDISAIDYGKGNITDVINSFDTPLVEKYASKMNVDVPKAGVFYQNYIEADRSFVIKTTSTGLYMETLLGEATGIVNGTKETEKYDVIYNEISEKSHYFELIKMVQEWCAILGSDSIEFEIVFKKDTYYIVQAI